MEEDILESALPVDDAGVDESPTAPAPARQAVPTSRMEAAPQEEGGGIFDGLAEALGGALQGLQEMFGLSPAQAAVPDPQSPNMRGAEAMYRGAGAASADEMKAIRQTVDPRDQLSEGVAHTAGLINAYQYYAGHGDMKNAQRLAASIVQYTRERSIALGGLALEAIKDGNMTDGAKALVQAFNVIPNGQQVSIQNGVGLIKDAKSGEVVKELKLTPQVMIAAATRLASGEDYYKLLIDAAGKKGGVGGGAGMSGGLSDEQFQQVVQEGLKNGFIPTIGMSKEQLAQVAPINSDMRHTKDQTALGDRFDKSQEASTNKMMTMIEHSDKVHEENRKADNERFDRQQKAIMDKEERAATQKLRSETAKTIGDKDEYDDASIMGPLKPGVVINPKQAEATRTVAQHFAENNNLREQEALSYARQITMPGSQVQLNEGKDNEGYSVTMPDGESLELTPRAFRQIKRIRDGMEKSAKPDASSNVSKGLNYMGEGLRGGARSVADAAKSALQGAPVSSLDPRQDGVPMSAIDLNNVTTSSGYQQRFGR